MANLDPVKGHEQGGFRPVLVLQNDILNMNLSTVIIAPITKNMKAKGYLTTFFLDREISRLKFDGIALLYQIRTIDRSRLVKKVSSLDQVIFKSIKAQFSLIF